MDSTNNPFEKKASAQLAGGSSIVNISRKLSRFSARTTNSSPTKLGKGPLGLNTLYSPPNDTPIAELIFVHGLGGGSHSTWRASHDPLLFWPLEWLSTDDDFRNVRTHSFGYNSSWDKESILGIHDFANGLLRSIVNSPSISLNDRVPIIFVAHSMGGIIIKRLYVLAKCKPEYESLASRVHSMFFLATPHQGTNLAQILSRFLALSSGGPRPFLNDLSGQSEMIQSLNDEFPRYSKELQLFSFFETLPTEFSLKKTLIVPRASAVLGYPNEYIDHLHANHRDMCKYTSRDDPNYRSVRNALARTIKNLLIQPCSPESNPSKDQRHLVDTFLGVQDSPEDDFIYADGRRMSGSCEWLIQREGFRNWLVSKDSSVYCLAGGPGTGKTVLSGKVIAHLKQIKARSSVYFFHYNNKSTSDIATFLLSLARQMALQDDEVLKRCLDVYNIDENLSHRNYRTIWRKLFLESILSPKLASTHFWVIDALDECNEEIDLVPLLLKAAELGNIHIFFTTRNRYKPSRQLGPPKVEVVVEDVPKESSRADIALYLEANMDQLPVLTERGQKQIVNQVLEKSQGCFLWVNLVFQELRSVHTSADVNRVLNEIPTDMNNLYARILDNMSRTVYGKSLAKAIIIWTVCATRPLTIVELNEALALDLQDSIDSIEASIQSTCGHLIYVDVQSAVQVVHLTARDYLLDCSTQSEFTVEEKQGHRRLLLTCLLQLQRGERKASRRIGNSNNQNIPKMQSPFIRYAAESLHEHLRHLSWTDTSLMALLANFFASSSMPSWIEYIAANSDLSHLITTGEALAEFLGGVPEEKLIEVADLATLNSWATDLVRLVMQFGSNLKAYPGSIFNLISPFCPLKTAPRKQFGSVPRGITVRGVQGDGWGDCLSTISNPDQQYSSIASSKKHFSIGCFSGMIMVFEHFLYQQVATLDHLEPVRLLSFGYQHDVLASAGSKVIRVWNITSKSQTWRFDTPQQCMTLTFAEKGRQIVAAMKDHQLKTWNLIDGTLLADVNWTAGFEEMALKLYRRPLTAALSMDTQLLAVIYKGHDIVIWDIEDDCLYDIYNRESGATGYTGQPYGSSGVRCLEFGIGTSTDLLAAAYTDGELMLFDMSSGEVKKRGIDAFAHMLARSPDGSKLATADPSGIIQIFQFESLGLLYRINSVEPGIKGLTFSGDGQQLLDVRASRGRIWGPTVLVCKNHASRAMGAKPQEIDLKPISETKLITSIAIHDNGETFFCGKEDGCVYLFDIESGISISTLFSHANGVNIVSLQYNSGSKTITSVDNSGRVLIHRLNSQGKTMAVSDVLLDYRVELAIEQVLSRPDLGRVLLCSSESDELRSISEDGSEVVTKIPYSQRNPYQWANHPLHSDQLLLLTRSAIHVLDWYSLKPLTSPNGMRFDIQIPPDLSPCCIKPIFDNGLLAVMYGEIGRPLSNTKLIIYNTSQLEANNEILTAVTEYNHLCTKAVYIIGLVGQGSSGRLVFLRSGNWVSSVTAKSAMEGRISSHFFFPVDWMNTVNHLGLMIEVTKRGDVLMVKGGEVAIIRRGLNNIEFEETAANLQ